VPCQRRVVIKAEVVRAPEKDPKDNPRFLITNMKQSPQWISEKVYCQRGDIENRIKELHDLEIDRTSCSRMQNRKVNGQEREGEGRMVTAPTC
jgi:hypothetical protein